MITPFSGAPAAADFAKQFDAAMAVDQKARGTVSIEADSGAKPSKSQDGFDVLTRSVRSETDSLHTLHIYFAGHSGNRFDMAAFQTTSEESWNTCGTQAAQFVQSLRLANSLSTERVAQLLGTKPVVAAAPPTLPGFDDAPPVQNAAPAAQPAAAVNALAPTNVLVLPLEKSPIVVNDAVTQRDGKPIDGLKLSRHDFEIASPSIVVAPDSVIHVAFVEKHRTTFALAAHHRSSADGGKIWSDAKIPSEDLPSFGVGRCMALADARGRVYVIWRSSLREGFPANVDPRRGPLTPISSIACSRAERGARSSRRIRRVRPRNRMTAHFPFSPRSMPRGARRCSGIRRRTSDARR